MSKSGTSNPDNNVLPSKSILPHVGRSSTIHKIFQRGKQLAAARSKANEMRNRLHLTSRTCATRFSTSQIHEFRKLISSIHVYMATYTELHQQDREFEVKKWEICGQDFIADLCGCVDVLTPVITYLVDLQGLHVPIWKAAVWFPKVNADMDVLGKLSINCPPESCVNLKANIHDIKKFTFHGQELVEGWLIVGTEVRHGAGKERSEILTWRMRQLHDVEEDLQRLAKDLSASLKSRHDNCLSSLQSTLTCMDIDSILNLLVGKRNSNGYPSLTREDEFVIFGKESFNKFYTYICSLTLVKELAENHFTKLKLPRVYSDEIFAMLKNTLKIILWTPQHVEVLSRWLTILKEPVVADGKVI